MKKKAPEETEIRVRAPAGSRVREVPAVRRSVAILWYLAKHTNGLPLAVIARELDIIPSTCLHILRELSAGHLVSIDPVSKLYSLGLGVLGLSKSLSQHDHFIHEAQPLLNQLVRTLKVSASAQQLDGMDMVVVAASTPSEGIAGMVGTRVSCASSSVGRLVAAYSGWSEAELLTHFNTVRWQCPPEFQTWRDEVRVAGKQGYAIDRGEFRRGITSIAAPIFARNGQMNRSLSINVVTAQLGRGQPNKYIKAVKLAADDLASRLHD